jgi:hypothetical protein
MVFALTSSTFKCRSWSHTIRSLATSDESGQVYPPVYVHILSPGRGMPKNKFCVGFAKPVGTGPVRPIPGGTGPARYTNRSGSHTQTVPNIFNAQQTGRSDRYTDRFFYHGNRPSHGSVNPYSACTIFIRNSRITVCRGVLQEYMDQEGMISCSPANTHGGSSNRLSQPIEVAAKGKRA